MRKKRSFVGLAVVVIGALLAYAPFIGRFGFYNDDWYLLYGALTQGTEQFGPIFASDRPLRAVHMAFMWNLFGANIVWYHVSAILLRVISGWGLYSIIRRVWPSQQISATLAALFLVIYPGFTDMPNAYDYQSHILAFALAVVSILLTVIAFQSQKTVWRVTSLVFASLLQLVYLGLMEYYIGLEALRVFLLYLLVLHREPTRGFKSTLLKSIVWFLPGIIFSFLFLFWRGFFLDGSRETTNLTFILEQFVSAIHLRAPWLLLNFFQDWLKATLLAWGVPLNMLLETLRLKHLAAAIFVGLLGAGILWLLLKKGIIGSFSEMGDEPTNAQTFREMGWIGLLAIIFAILPANLGDRHIVFPSYTRFSFPPSIGVSLLLTAIWGLHLRSTMKIAFPVVMVFIGITTHFANGIGMVERWDVMRDFWWQVSWRVPQIQPETLIAATYANESVPEDYHIWGPANLIFYPESQRDDKKNIELALTASTYTHSDLMHMMLGEFSEINRRSFTSRNDFGNLLVMSMPASNICVHVQDGKLPLISDFDRTEIMVTAPLSQIERVDVTESSKTPPQVIFGSEPDHGWCYYYQKASLAHQQGNWQEAANLWQEARELNLYPHDKVELLPFLEAYAHLGDEQMLRQLTPSLMSTRISRSIICEAYEADQRKIQNSDPAAYRMFLEVVCDKK